MFCFVTSVLCMQRKSRNFCINNNTHNARREKASKIGESYKKTVMDPMLSMLLLAFLAGKSKLVGVDVQATLVSC